MLAPGKHYVGDVIRLAANYSYLDADIDPETVSLKVMRPDGVTVNYLYGTDAEIGYSDTGDYYCDYVIPQCSGRYGYRWVSTGTGTVSALEGDFLVQRSAFFDGMDRAYG